MSPVKLNTSLSPFFCILFLALFACRCRTQYLIIEFSIYKRIDSSTISKSHNITYHFVEATTIIYQKFFKKRRLLVKISDKCEASSNVNTMGDR